MRRLFAFFISTFLYLECVYHFAAFGWTGGNPVLLLPLILLGAGVQTMVCGLFSEKGNKILLWVCLAVDFILYFSQYVYISIFDQPLLIDAAIGAGGAAMADFGTEAMHGILASAGVGLLMAVPLVVMGIFLHKKLFVTVRYVKRQWIEAGVAAGAGFLVMLVLLLCGYHMKWRSYEEYQSFYDPASVICRYGVLPSVQRDLTGDLLPASSSALDELIMNQDTSAYRDEENSEENSGENSEGDGEKNPSEGNLLSSTGAGEETDLDINDSGVLSEEEQIDTSPNVLNVDFAKIQDSDANDAVKQLAAYMETMEPTKKNEYTGMFEGYNLIYMTAEGFSPYAIDETLTPTLYKLTHSGFVAKDYYVPLWQTSTSDGEYVNLTGLVPDHQFSMRRTSENEQPYSLPAYFAAEGVKSYAYHNNSLSYYDRYKSHPNLGYDFKAAKSGKLSEEEWAGQLFEMENENLWPCSDLEMIKATLPEYIGEDRFHAYYMTISGHLEYTFDANDMSERYQEEVSGLLYSEAGRAYIACNMDLDRALEYLIEELEKAGKLEHTVIAISSDHYPYGLEVSQIEELAGEDGIELEGSLDLYRNSLILWNSEMETVSIEKTCSAIDLLPTIYNLFGFEYDSRLFAGKDMLSDSESFVVFANQSFITDTMKYNSEKRKVERLDGSEMNEEAEEELERNKQKTKALFEYSAGILNEGFYSYVEDAVVK